MRIRPTINRTAAFSVWSLTNPKSNGVGVSFRPHLICSPQVFFYFNKVLLHSGSPSDALDCDLSSLNIVELFAVAMTHSSNVPPIDPLSILFTSQSRVQTSNSNRMGTPRIVSTAIVPPHEANTGSHPRPLFANVNPRATFKTMINAATYGERVLRAMKLRTPDVVELADAARLPSSMKCTA